MITHVKDCSSWKIILVDREALNAIRNISLALCVDCVHLQRDCDSIDTLSDESDTKLRFWCEEHVSLLKFDKYFPRWLGAAAKTKLCSNFAGILSHLQSHHTKLVYGGAFQFPPLRGEREWGERYRWNDPEKSAIFCARQLDGVCGEAAACCQQVRIFSPSNSPSSSFPALTSFYSLLSSIQ